MNQIDNSNWDKKGTKIKYFAVQLVWPDRLETVGKYADLESAQFKFKEMAHAGMFVILIAGNASILDVHKSKRLNS